MTRFQAPEGSVTERSVRMAYHYEYMVPIETAWELEQALNRAREDLRARFDLWMKAAMWRDEWRNMTTALVEALHGSPEHQKEAIDRAMDLMMRETKQEKAQ
jgi:chemotaxis regulatin CheY-phosphate phosphatase CheZ